jgi:sRNA-binding protein
MAQHKVRVAQQWREERGARSEERRAKREAQREAAAQPPANDTNETATRNSAWGKLDRPIAKPPANERGPNQRGVCPLSSVL